MRRVDSKANLADGPTRDNLRYVLKLMAGWTVPVLPDWVFNFWRFDGQAADLTVVRTLG